jgi:hypothetical protein
MIIRYTRYAQEKFEALHAYNVFIRKEEVEECLLSPERLTKKGRALAARRDGIKVVYRKEGEIIKVITFFPVKKKL